MATKTSGDKTAVFETVTPGKALAIMALPTAISQLISFAYQITDAWFIGRTNNQYMIAAISLVQVWFLLVVALANLFGAGGGSLLARLLGKGDEEGARKACSYSIAIAGIVSIVFAIVCFFVMDPMMVALGASENTLGYAHQYTLCFGVFGAVPTILGYCMPMLMRNAGYPKEAGIGVALGSILNIALDPLLMFVIMPDGYQVMAAGLATTIANYIMLAYFIVMFRRLESKSVLQLPRRIEKLDGESKKSIYSVGIPTAIVMILFNSLTVVLNGIAASYSDNTLAAVGIVMKLERLPQNLGFAICLGMVPLLAYNFSKRNYKRMDAVFNVSRLSLIVLGLFSALLFFFAAEPLIHAFLDIDEVVDIGAKFLVSRAFSLPLMLLAFQITYYMQAINKGQFLLLLCVLRHLVFSIPFMIVFNNLFGIEGLMWSQLVADAVNLLVAYPIYLAIKKKTLV